MDVLLSVCLGLGLAAACGFRVFVPFLVVNLAAQSGYLVLDGGFEWIASTPALITLAVATALEIAAYYIPWLDNLLDSVATPAAVVAGIVVTASVVTGIDPYLKWSLAVIAGGGVAGAVQATTVGARGASSLTTGGLANPLVTTAEIGGSVLLSGMAIGLPLLTALVVLVLMGLAARRGRRRAASPPVSPD
ncbi:MAG: DUF4126 domain-containing protein [Thermoanaerobaculia bacterium]